MATRPPVHPVKGKTRKKAPTTRAAKPAPADGRLSRWLPGPWRRRVLIGAGVAAGLVLIVLIYAWIRVAGMIDRRLGGGDDPPMPRIYGRAFAMRPGQPLSISELRARLNDVGYSEKVKVELMKIDALRDLQYAQPLDYPSLQVQINRNRAGQFGAERDLVQHLGAFVAAGRVTGAAGPGIAGKIPMPPGVTGKSIALGHAGAPERCPGSVQRAVAPERGFMSDEQRGPHLTPPQHFGQLLRLPRPAGVDRQVQRATAGLCEGGRGQGW